MKCLLFFCLFLQQGGKKNKSQGSSQAHKLVGLSIRGRFSSSQSKPGAQVLCLLSPLPWGCSMSTLGQGWDHQKEARCLILGCIPPLLLADFSSAPTLDAQCCAYHHQCFLALWHRKASSLTCCHISLGLILICLQTDAVSTPGSMPLTAVLQPSSNPQRSAPCLLSPAQARHRAQAAVSVRYSSGAMLWAWGHT